MAELKEGEEIHSWVVDQSQVDQLKEALADHPQFKRQEKIPGTNTPMIKGAEWFADNLGNTILIAKGEEKGKFVIKSKHGSAPIIEDVLGKRQY